MLPSKRVQRGQRAAVRAKDVPVAEAIVIVVVAVAEVVRVAAREVTVVAIPVAVVVDAEDGKNSSQYSVPSCQ